MLEATELNFIAKGDLSQLKGTIHFLEQQQDILQSFYIALRALKRGLSDRNKRYRRRQCFNDMTTFVSQNYNQTNNRRRALESLNDDAKYFCFISLAPVQIKNLREDSFDALVHGIHEFIKADPSQHDLIRTVSRENEAPQPSVVYQPSPAPKKLTGKRRKRASSRTPSPKRPEPPRPSNPAPMPSTTAIMAEDVLPDRQDHVHTEQTDPAEPDLQSNSSPATWLNTFNYPYWPTHNMTLDISMPTGSDSQTLPDALSFTDDSHDPFWMIRGIDFDPAVVGYPDFMNSPQ